MIAVSLFPERHAFSNAHGKQGQGLDAVNRTTAG